MKESSRPKSTFTVRRILNDEALKSNRLLRTPVAVCVNVRRFHDFELGLFQDTDTVKISRTRKLTTEIHDKDEGTSSRSVREHSSESAKGASSETDETASGEQGEDALANSTREAASMHVLEECSDVCERRLLLEIRAG